MTTTSLKESDFERTVSEGIVFVDFWAAWCGPCRNFSPVFEAASEQHPDIVFGPVDTEAEQLLAATAAVTSIPTLMAFRTGYWSTGRRVPCRRNPLRSSFSRCAISIWTTCALRSPLKRNEFDSGRVGLRKLEA